MHSVSSVVTEAWGFDASNLESTSELVDDESCEGLALHILSDNEERLLGLHAGLEEGEHLLDRADLLVDQEDRGVLELNLGGLGVSHEVG